MIKYFIAALLLHSLLFFSYQRYNTLGDPNFSVRSNIPISYNIVNAEQRIDSMKQVKGGEEVQSEPEEKEPDLKPEKKEEPEIKSKISNDKKKEEPKKEKKVSEKVKNSKKNSEKPVDKKVQNNDGFIGNENFTLNSDGSYTAISSKGINFEIITQTDPDYPRQAEVIRYNKTVAVEVRFLVDLEGNVENIKILKSHEKFGFDKEVISAVKKWKFKPIIYNGRKIKVYFNKEFVFIPKS